MTNKIKPLLASKADLNKIAYPVMASPKLDGIRCLGLDGSPKSRTLKDIPNKYIQETLSALPINGLDGELMIEGDFNKVQSGVMSHDGEPNFLWHVFDCFQDVQGNDISNLPFATRFHIAKRRCERVGMPLQIVPHTVVHSENALLKMLDNLVSVGYEGVMTRDPEGMYKYGRSTVNEGILLKIKKFFDDEAVLIAITEKMHNANAAEKDELGHTKRSLAKANLIPAATAGAMIVEWRGEVFKIGFGPGITDKIKKDWWRRRYQLLTQKVTFSYQELSKDGIPRFGKMIAFRHADDMSE